MAGGIVTCPPGAPATDTCAAMPCPTGQNCGTVVAGPTVNLGANQFVFLNFSGFVPGDNGITVYYCADPGAATTLNGIPPVCGNQGNQKNQFLQTFPSTSSSALPPGTTEASLQAAEVSAPSTPIPGQQFHPTVPSNGFYCDGTSANACSIVITDATLNQNPTSTSANSVQIPISFAPSTNGCTNAPVVSTESEFGIDVLIPQLARLSCANDPSTAVIPFETATDGLQAVTDLASGQQQIAFTDDPEAADQQAKLKAGNFALIPIALTANVVGFFAQLNVPIVGFFNQDEMDLTPTMVSGLLTNASNYSDAALADDVVPCSGPSQGTDGSCLPGPPCYADATCSLFTQLNFVTGFTQFSQELAFQRSDNSGATDQLFNWLCSAPTVPLNFGSGYGSGPTETMSGAQELEYGLTPPSGPPVTTCPSNTDQVPAVGGVPRFTEVNDPSQQALKAFDGVYLSNSTNPYAAFANMNWAEARYYGMNVAALQNAGGNFVQPTQQSLDAAVTDATQNPDGGLTPRNLASDPAAYPMPSVIYAAVSTAPMPQNQATAITDLLNQLLQLTTGTEAAQNPSAQLPQGFVPLPANLATIAQADVTKDIHVLPVTVTPPPPPPSPSSTPSGSGGSPDTSSTGTTSDLTSASGSFFSDTTVGDTGGLFSPLAEALVGATSAASPATGPHSVLPLLGPALPGFALAASRGKAFLPATLIVGLSALVLGMILMTSGYLSRRKLLRPAALAVDDGADAVEGVETP